jgi:HlyD family secretion protein
MRVLALIPLLGTLVGCNNGGAELALGTLERDRVALTATVAEVVVALPVAQGTPVKKGTLLARLDNRLQRAKVERAGARVAQSTASLEKLRNGARPEEIAAARAHVEGARAELREAQITYERNAQLLNSKSVSHGEVDRSLSLRDAAGANLKAAQDALDALVAGARAEDLSMAESELRAAQAELAYEQALLADLDILATRDGVLDNLPWNLGERVSVGSPVAILLAGDAPYVRIYVPEPHRVNIHKGDSLRVWVDGLEDSLVGQVRWISSEPAFTPYYALNAEDRSRLMFLAQVQLPQSAADLPSGVPAQVEMP